MKPGRHSGQLICSFGSLRVVGAYISKYVHHAQFFNQLIMKKQIYRVFLVLCFSAGIAVSAFTQNALSLFDQLSGAEILELEIETDLSTLHDQRNTNVYQNAVLTYTLGKKEKVSWDIHIRSRGKYRRRICVFPPLKLKFPKAELKTQGFAADNEFKLVTHCVEGDIGKDYILREFLAYKLFKELSPVYFNVQLVRVRYSDSKTQERTNAWGILMEDEKALERRFNGEICNDCFGLPKSEFSQENLSVVYLFQYLLSNTDWNTAMVRNMVLMRPKAGGKAVLVPYDFDFSGFVNASYASPNRDYGQKSIRERVFIGAELSDVELQDAITYFRTKRSALEKIILDFKPISGASQDDLIQFLDSFYRSLEAGIQRAPSK